MKKETAEQISEYIEYLLNNSSAEKPMWNKELVREGKPNKWNYIDGCMITALLSLYEMTGRERYFEFAKDFVDYFVQEDGTIRTYNIISTTSIRQATCSISMTGQEIKSTSWRSIT